jgi:hypothetical protein
MYIRPSVASGKCWSVDPGCSFDWLRISGDPQFLSDGGTLANDYVMHLQMLTTMASHFDELCAMSLTKEIKKGVDCRD